MELNVGKEVATLERMTVGELQDRYAEVFGEITLGRKIRSEVIAGRSVPVGLCRVCGIRSGPSCVGRDAGGFGVYGRLRSDRIDDLKQRSARGPQDTHAWERSGPAPRVVG